MAGLNVGSFTGAVVGVTVAVLVIVVVAIPIISANLLPTEGEDVFANADTINNLMTIIPIFLIIAVLIAVIGLFVKSKA